MSEEPREMDWTDEERDALEALPRAVEPDRLLEERTVAALKERGLLRASSGGADAASSGAGPRIGTGPGGRAGRAPGAFHPAWWAAGIAAALALFFAGLAIGQARSSVTPDDLIQALQTAEAAERPSLVQHTGSLYVDAVASLAAARAEGDEATVGTGVEVGISALYAAALELARLHPEDPRLRQVLRALDQAEETTSPDVHWF